MKNRSLRGISKEKVTSLLALLSFTAYMPVSCLSAFAAVDMNLPSLNKAANGSVDKVSNSYMNVKVEGGKGTVGQFDWNSFNVAKGNTVNFQFSANSQTALNRVLASGGMSYIYGKLTESSANGCPACTNTSKVILINPSGVLFGNGSQVNLNSFTASTYDIKNAKDLNSMIEGSTDYNNYVGTGGTTGELFSIAGYNSKIQYIANDNTVSTRGDGIIAVDPTGTRLASIVIDGKANSDGTTASTQDSDIYADKTIALIGNKIDVKNANVHTNYSVTPNMGGTPDNRLQKRSNIKLVTGDGVNFYYTTSGNIANDKFSRSTDLIATNHANTADTYGVNIDNAEIRTGDFYLTNDVEKDNSQTKINNSLIYAKKMPGTDFTDANTGAVYHKETSGTYGDINIIGYSNSVDISDSDIQTTNANNTTAMGIKYGNLSVQGKNDVNITDTNLRTAASNNLRDANGNVDSGNLKIVSANGNVNINKTKDTSLAGKNAIYNSSTMVSSAGDLSIKANNGDVNINGYDAISAQASTVYTGTDKTRTANVQAKNVNIDNTTLVAGTRDTNSTFTVDAAENANVKDTRVTADNFNVYAKNTKVDNSLLQYKNLKFHDDVATGGRINNVTIANNTTLRDTDSDTLDVVTNGTLTIDGTSLMKKSIDGSVNANQDAINLVSTKGNVIVKGGKTIKTTAGDITANAANGSVIVNNTTLDSAGGITVNAGNNATAENASILYARGTDKNINITAGNNVTSNESIIRSINSTGDVNINAGNNVAINGSTSAHTRADNGNVNITAGNNVAVGDGVRVWAKDGDMTIKATNGKTTVQNGSAVIAEGGKTTIVQKGDMNIDTDFNKGTIGTTEKLTLKTDGNITGSKLTLKTQNVSINNYNSENASLISLNNDDADKDIHFIFPGAVGKGIELNAGDKINLTDVRAAQNADFVAGNGINIASTGDMKLKDVSTKSAGDTNITAAGTLTPDGLTIKTPDNGNAGTTTLTGGNIINTNPAVNKIDAGGNKLALVSPGTIDIGVTHADNPNNGLEVNAKINTGWHGGNNYGQDELIGRNVSINAGGEALAISKIKADKLNLTAGKIVKGNGADITKEWDNVNGFTDAEVDAFNNGNKAYVEVRTDGGFNLDTSKAYPGNSNVQYADGYNRYVTDTNTTETIDENAYRVNTTQDVETITYRDGLTKSETTTGATTTTKTLVSSEVINEEDGPTETRNGESGHYHIVTTRDTYEITDTTPITETTYYTSETKETTYQNYDMYKGKTVTTTTREQQHVATMGDDAQGFVLVYGKTKTDVDNSQAVKVDSGRDEVGSTITKTNFIDNKTTDVKETNTYNEINTRTDITDKTTRTWCADEDPVDPEIPDSISTLAKIPRHAEGISNSAPVQNDLADTTATVVAAAARLEIADEDGEYEEDEDELSEE